MIIWKIIGSILFIIHVFITSTFYNEYLPLDVFNKDSYGKYILLSNLFSLFGLFLIFTNINPIAGILFMILL